MRLFLLNIIRLNVSFPLKLFFHRLLSVYSSESITSYIGIGLFLMNVLIIYTRTLYRYIYKRKTLPLRSRKCVYVTYFHFHSFCKYYYYCSVSSIRRLYVLTVPTIQMKFINCSKSIANLKFRILIFLKIRLAR